LLFDKKKMHKCFAIAEEAAARAETDAVGASAWNDCRLRGGNARLDEAMEVLFIEFCSDQFQSISDGLSA